MRYPKLRQAFLLFVAIVMMACVVPANSGLAASAALSHDVQLPFPPYPGTNDSMSIAGFKRDAQGKSHVLYQQQYKGIPVYGKYAYVHKNAANQIYAATDKFDDALNGLELDVTPVLTGEEAIAVLGLFLEERHGQPVQFGTGQESFPIAPPAAELVVYPYDDRYYLAYQVEADYMVPSIGSWIAFVDAKDGRLIHAINKTRHAVSPVEGSGTGTFGVLPLQVSRDHTDGRYYTLDASRAMYDGAPIDLERYLDLSSGALEEQGLIITMDYASLNAEYGNSAYILKPISSETSHGFTDTHAVDAHYWTGEVYEFYRDQFGRDSIDDEGMDLYSFVHVVDIDLSTGREIPLDNAFWALGAMWYGDGGEGSDALFNCLSCANDIVAHELTHGVIEHTANLLYENQSGALNESIADIMAVVFDADDWTIGEDAGTVPLRDLANPHRGLQWQPKHMNEYVYLPNTEAGDYGGVHINSGIPNHAAYLMATHLEDADFDGRYLLGQLTYRALTTYLHPASDFMDARFAYLQAVDYLSLTQQEKEEVRSIVKRAWDAVGVTLSPDSYMFMYDHYYNEENGAFPVFFNASVTASVYFNQIALTSLNGSVPTQTALDGDALLIQPTAPLSHGVSYNVHIPADALKDKLGDALPNPHAITFTADKVGPSWANNALASSDVTTSGFRLTWPHAVDDHTLAGYAVYLNGRKWNDYSPDVNGVTFRGLNANTTYDVRVTAYDAAGNGTSRTTSVKTLAIPGGGFGGGPGGGFFGGGFPTTDNNESEENSKTIITVKPDERRIQDAIDGDAEVIIIDAKAEAGVNGVIVELSAELVKQANAKQKAWRIETNDATYTFEPGFVADSRLSGTLVFTILDATSDGALNNRPEGTAAVAPVIDLKLQINEQAVSSFLKPVKIAMHVRAQTSELHKLGAYYYNERQRSWAYIGGKVSANGRTVQFETDHFSQFTVFAYHKLFKDVQGHWAQIDIETMAARHIAQGVTADSFAPNTPITRAEFTALLVRTLQLEERSDKQFADVPSGSWYAEAVNRAFTAGIVNGVDQDHFAPSTRITREQMAVMIVQAYAKAKGVDAANLQTAVNAAQFADIEAASEWAKSAIGSAASLGLISGRPDGSFDPKANASRAEAISMIKRLLDLID
ncbi:hypothetical protein XYCOK13_41580 [Xylanibacillus composti]|uniref:Zn-dependent metalloprotease n=1 Tax=Xylanibacillus composti TaxID=1572762 RepID=A0A8J4H8X5_9BACL|nr:S-layer homology domain-containing protein [Xylanibacillus composti]GIQ71334.1 hypothetical protein XYCOK13_41580 [Xylanibacillus composti]